jgi:hypothetical protein
MALQHERTPIELRLAEIHKRLLDVERGTERLVQKVKGPRPETSGSPVGTLGHSLTNTIDDLFPVVTHIENDLTELHAEIGYDSQPKQKGLGTDSGYDKAQYSTQAMR